MSTKIKPKKEKSGEIKAEEELSDAQQASAQDILKDLGQVSEAEYEYYKNL